MMKLYAAPRTRALRVAWLLEELELPYDLVLVEFQPTTSTFFIQHTPTGKIPTLADDDILICESGAIVEYILERYGTGRLAPAISEPQRAEFLQWLHFSESSAFGPIGNIVWLTVYRDDAADHPAVVADAVSRAGNALQFIEQHLENSSYLVGDCFSAADIMMGFTLLAAKMFDLLRDKPNLRRYLERLEERAGFQQALAKLR